MVSSLNKVTLIGKCTQPPEFRSMQNGKELATLNIGTYETYIKDGKREYKNEYHRVVIFSEGLVKIAKDYLKKDSQVYIEGALHTRKWTDKSGVDKYVTEIVLQGYGGVLKMLGDKSDSAKNAPTEKTVNTQMQGSSLEEDKTPF